MIITIVTLVKNKKTSPIIQAYTFLIVYVPYKINLQNFTQDMHVVCVCPRQNIFKKNFNKTSTTWQAYHQEKIQAKN